MCFSCFFTCNFTIFSYFFEHRFICFSATCLNIVSVLSISLYIVLHEFQLFLYSYFQYISVISLYVCPYVFSISSYIYYQYVSEISSYIVSNMF